MGGRGNGSGTPCSGRGSPRWKPLCRRGRGSNDDAVARHHRGRLPHDVREGQNGAAAGPPAGDDHRPTEGGGAEERDLLFENRRAPRDERVAGGYDLSFGSGKNLWSDEVTSLKRKRGSS